MIIDLTEDRPNCYFEAGYAVALDKKLSFSGCTRRRSMEAVFHFDVHDYPFILYGTLMDLRKQLRDKLKALLGES